MSNIQVKQPTTPVKVTAVTSSVPVKIAVAPDTSVKVDVLIQGPPGRPGLDGSATLGDIDLGTFN